MRRVVTSFSFVLAVLALSPKDSRADIPPPDVELCSGKAVGEACDGGTCQNGECARATPDGTVSYACVRCVPGTTTEEPKAAPTSEKKNCGAAPDAMLLGLAGLAGARLWARRKS